MKNEKKKVSLKVRSTIKAGSTTSIMKTQHDTAMAVIRNMRS